LTSDCVGLASETLLSDITHVTWCFLRVSTD
jgi:hypothetical protein